MESAREGKEGGYGNGGVCIIGFRGIDAPVANCI